MDTTKWKKKLINLNHNYISSTQIYESNKFLKNYFCFFPLRFRVWESPNSWIPNLMANLYFGLY